MRAIRERTEGVRSAAHRMAGEKHEMMRAYVAHVVEGKLDSGLEKAKEVVKKKAKDEDMPGIVKRSVDAAVDDMWVEVKYEVLDSVLSSVRIPLPVDHGEPPAWCWNPLGVVRAWVLYTLFPYVGEMCV